MNNSLLIGQAIYSILSSDTNIKGLVNTKIYPLVAENTTTYPYIVYFRDSLSVELDTKDGYCEDTCNFTIVCISNNYSQSITIANKVRNVMCRKRIVFDDMKINEVKLTGADETFSEDAYIQKLSFTCKINN